MQVVPVAVETAKPVNALQRGKHFLNLVRPVFPDNVQLASTAAAHRLNERQTWCFSPADAAGSEIVFCKMLIFLG